MRGVPVGAAVSSAASDFYFNSWRFVAANVAWSLALLAVLFLAVFWTPALLLLVLVAAPLAGLHRMAALLVREQPVGLDDFFDGTRRYGVRAAGIAAGGAMVAAALVTNAVTGFTSDGPLGWFLGATAIYGLIALAMFLVAVWPVLVDPNREAAPLRRTVRLAALVVIGRPGRLLLVTLLIAVILLISTVLLAAIVLFGVAFASIVGTRWVLAAADELESRFEARAR